MSTDSNSAIVDQETEVAEPKRKRVDQPPAVVEQDAAAPRA